MTQSHRSVLGLVLKGILAGILYIVGAMLASALFAALHIPLVNVAPPGTDLQKSGQMFLLATPLIGLALLPLARHTAGPRAFRGVLLSFLIFICAGLTSVMEMRIFLTGYAHGGALAAILVVIPPALLCGFGLSFLLPQQQRTFPPRKNSTPSFLHIRWFLGLCASCLSFLRSASSIFSLARSSLRLSSRFIAPVCSA